MSQSNEIILCSALLSSQLLKSCIHNPSQHVNTESSLAVMKIQRKKQLLLSINRSFSEILGELGDFFEMLPKYKLSPCGSLLNDLSQNEFDRSRCSMAF